MSLPANIQKESPGDLNFPERRVTIDEKTSFATTPIRNFAGDIYGTGFYFVSNQIVVITCLHVIDKMIRHNPDKDEFSYEVRISIKGTRRKLFKKADIFIHPTEDLVAIVVSGIDFEHIPITALTPSDVCRDEMLLQQLSVVEMITLFGYQAAIYDEANSLPTVRVGYTASHPGLDIDNKPHGRLNIAAYKGDSGSPVLLAPQNISYNNEKGGIFLGLRSAAFLGIYTGSYRDNGTVHTMALGHYVKAKSLITSWEPYKYLAVRPGLHSKMLHQHSVEISPYDPFFVAMSEMRSEIQMLKSLLIQTPHELLEIKDVQERMTSIQIEDPIDLSSPRDSDRITKSLLDHFYKDIKDLAEVISFSFTCRNFMGSDEIIIILYTRKVAKVRESLIDWPPTKSQQFENFHLKFVPLDYDLQPDFRGQEETRVIKLDVDQERLIWSALQEAQNEFFDSHRNVVGVTVGSTKDGRPCLNVFVHSKGYIPLGEKTLPKILKGIPIKVIEGRYYQFPKRLVDEYDVGNAAGDYQYNEIIRPGCSLGIMGTHYVGTLGGIVINVKNPVQKYLLTNRHVAIDVCNPVADRHIIQPASKDYKRDRLSKLIIERDNLMYKKKIEDRKIQIESSEYDTWVKRIEVIEAMISKNDPQITLEDEKACVVGKVSIHQTLGSSEFEVDILGQTKTMRIGLDAALILFESPRLLSVNPTFYKVVNNKQTEIPLQTSSQPIPFGLELDEDQDLVYKNGRTTGVTTGYPKRYPGGVVARVLGDYQFEEDTAMTFSHDRYPACPVPEEHKHPAVSLWNQYLIRHLGSRVFAQPGDSGSICYVQRMNEIPLRPWGLLNGVLSCSEFAYGIASPIDVTLRQMGSDLVLVTEENKSLLEM